MTKIKFIEGSIQELIEWGRKGDEMGEIEEIKQHLKRSFGLINKSDLIKQTKFLLSSLEGEKRETERWKGDWEKLNEHIKGKLEELKRAQIELMQADQLREIRDGQLEEFKVELERIREEHWYGDYLKEKERTDKLEKELKAEKLINLMTKEETVIPLRMWVKSLQERIKELEELIATQNDTITNSETRINEVEVKLASIKADESIGKLIVEVSEDETMEDYQSGQLGEGERMNLNEPKKEEEGWGLPNMSRKWHYFINTMSFCRKYGFYGGPLEQGKDDSPDNCSACRKIKKSKGI